MSYRSVASLLVLMCALTGCDRGKKAPSEAGEGAQRGEQALRETSGEGEDRGVPGVPHRGQLEVLREVKLAQFLGQRRLEGSALALRGEHLLVAFDNLGGVGALPHDLVRGAGDPGLRGLVEEDSDYEGLSWDSRKDVLYAVVEGIEDAQGKLRSEIHRLDPQKGALRAREPIEFSFPRDEKGFEGLAHRWVGAQLYLLALCEGNGCSDSERGGQGRIQVLRKSGKSWQRVDSIALPEGLDFADYSGLDLKGDQLAVVSQQEGALWLGKLVLRRPDGEDRLRWGLAGLGAVYTMPRGYCNIEGVVLLGQGKLALVSDRAKKKHRARCEAKDQSLHIVKLP